MKRILALLALALALAAYGDVALIKTADAALVGPRRVLLGKSKTTPVVTASEVIPYYY